MVGLYVTWMFLPYLAGQPWCRLLPCSRGACVCVVLPCVRLCLCHVAVGLVAHPDVFVVCWLHFMAARNYGIQSSSPTAASVASATLVQELLTCTLEIGTA